jgi:hypothetical protein
MVFLFFYFIFSIIIGAVATSRGRSGFGWFLLALLISPLLSLIIVLILPTAHASDIARLQVHSEPQKRCPFCAELINVQAIKCRHCASALVLGGEPTAAYATEPDPVISGQPAPYDPSRRQSFGAELVKALIPLAILAMIVAVVAYLR